MSSFAYSVAIKLSVANLASQGVRILANDLLKAHGAATNLQNKLSALKMVAVGYGLDRAGQGILGFMGKTLEVSKEYTRQLSLMNAAGMSQKDIAEATAQAWKTSQSVITSSAAENLQAIRELRSVFGLHHMGEAYAILPTVQRTKAVLEALTGKEQEGVAFDMVKAIELRTPGVMSAQRMQQNADLMARALMGMGGTLTVNDFHMALKQAKTSAFGLNDDFVYGYLPTLIQEVKTKGGGAQTAGTALMSTYAAVIQGTLKKSAIPLWEQMGLINPSDVVKNSTGQMQLKPGAVKGAQLFQQSPYQWANEVLAPAIDAYSKSHGLNREQVISGLFGNRNAQWFINTLIGKASQFERDRELIASGGSSKEAYDRLLKSNPQLAEQALHNQWQNVLAILGYQILPKILPLMVKFADGLSKISAWMADHPNLTATIALGLGAVGLALSGIGKAMMLVGILRFLGLAGTITGLGTAAAGAAGATGIGGLIATLGGPLVLALGAVAAAVGLVVAIANHGQKVQDDSHAGKDVGVQRAGKGHLLHWVQDAYGRGGNYGHWEGVGSGHMNANMGPQGQPINSKYRADLSQVLGNIMESMPAAKPQVTVNVNNKLDVQGLTTAVTVEQTKRAGRPNTGTNGFNSGYGRPMPGGVKP